MLFHLGDGQHIYLHSMCQKYPESRKNESQAAGSHHRSWDATQRQFDLREIWDEACRDSMVTGMLGYGHGFGMVVPEQHRTLTHGVTVLQVLYTAQRHSVARRPSPVAHRPQPQH